MRHQITGLLSFVLLSASCAFASETTGAATQTESLPNSRPAITAGFKPDSLTPSTKPEIYQDGWIDFNKNGIKDPYEDPIVKIEKRINNLLDQMNSNEKSCQLATLYGYPRVLRDQVPNEKWKTAIWKDGLANIDQHLDRNTPYAWPPSKHARAMNETQRFFIEETRLGIPVDFTIEGIHGLFFKNCTNFPEPLAIGASWDIELARKIAQITAREAKATGYTNVYSPILDLSRDPRWGRVRECYSEDPFLTGQMGIATVQGMQGEGIASTAKHFTIHGIPKGGRDCGVRKDPQIGRREMQMLHLEPFRMVMKAGILGLMTSHNDYDGVPINASREFLTDILRDQWGFKGYLVSDSGSVLRTHYEHRTAKTYKEAIAQAVNAGLNVRTDFTPTAHYVAPMRELIKEGKISTKQLDRLVRQVLRVKFMIGLFNNPYVVNTAASDKIIRNKQHQTTALEIARKCMVLLKNEKDLLPLDTNKYKKILITGPAAKDNQFGAGRYGPVGTPMVSLYDGLKAVLPQGTSLDYSPGCRFVDSRYPISDILPEDPQGKEKQMIDNAVAKAKEAELAIVAVGDNNDIIGESRSRINLNLSGFQEELIKAIQKTGTPTIVVLCIGRPATINWTAHHVPAILCGWAMGEASGTALAEALVGKINPGGKLPITFPQSVGQIPLAFPSRPGSNCGHFLNKKWNKQGFNVGKNRVLGPLYPFGYGLSYTTFKYSNTEVKPMDNCKVQVSLDITNTGKVAGDEIIQCYLRDDYTSVACYEIMLKGFKRVTLEPGETRKVSFILDKESMQMVDVNHKWVVEPGVFTVMIGRSSENMEYRGAFTVYKDENGNLQTRLSETKESVKPTDPGNRHRSIYQGELHKGEKRIHTAEEND